MMFTSMFVEYDGLIVIVIGVLFIWFIRNSYKIRQEKAGMVFNCVDVSAESLVFGILKKKRTETYDVKVSISNINEVVVKDAKIDSIVGKKTVKVFEFKHCFGNSYMLRHDIDEREEFIEMLESKGIPLNYLSEEAQNNGKKQNVSADYTIDLLGKPLPSHKVIQYTNKKGLIASLSIIILIFLFSVCVMVGSGNEYSAVGMIIESLMNSSFICLLLCLVGLFQRWVFGKGNRILDVRWSRMLAVVSIILLVLSGLVDKFLL